MQGFGEDPSENLDIPLGEPGSGYIRYAAAMQLYMRGDMSAEMLEIYRRCCKFDRDDPIAIAKAEGIAP